MQIKACLKLVSIIIDFKHLSYLPMSIKPFFVVNACSKCDQHKYARHDEAKYAAYRDAIIAALKSAIPTLDDSQIVTGKLPQEYRTQ